MRYILIIFTLCGCEITFHVFSLHSTIFSPFIPEVAIVMKKSLFIYCFIPLGNFSSDLKNISVALGYGTTHKVNNKILQGSFEDRYCHSKIWSPKKKRIC